VSSDKRLMIDRYLTRSDIAKILKVSPKHAGQLMWQMPFVRVGKSQRRVATDDFEAWCLARRSEPANKAPTKRPASKHSPTRTPFCRPGSILERA